MKKIYSKQCVYCKIIKPSSEFNTEHVIPESCGVFGPDTMTLDCVCTDCNSYFGQTIDMSLARDSIFGILGRTITGLQTPEEFKKSIRHFRERIEPSVSHPELGDILVNIEQNPQGSFNATIANQVLIRNSTNGRQLSFRLDTIPHKRIIEGIGLKPTTGHIVFLAHEPHLIAMLQDPNSAINKSCINIRLGKKVAEGFRFGNDALAIDFYSFIDETIIRAISKIAFNYFVKFAGREVGLSSSFDLIRNFIRNGAKAVEHLVTMDTKIFNAKVQKGKRGIYNRHIISFQQELHSQHIIAHVSLFNEVHFEVVLSRSYPLLIGSKKRSLFDIQYKKIVDLTTQLLPT